MQAATNMQAECAALMRDYCAAHQAPANWRQTHPEMKLLKASIYRIESDHFSTPVGIKAFRTDLVSAAFPEKLFHEWQIYAAQSAPEGFCVPAIYAVLPHSAALMMEWIEAKNMGDILLQNLHRPHVRVDAIRRAGGWLKWFHGVGGVENLPYDSSMMLGKIEAMIEKVNAQNAAVMPAQKTFWHCLDVLRRATPRFHGVSVPHAPVHGDFTPYNLLLPDDGRTAGIDFLAHGRMPVTFDICHFLVYLDVHRFWLTAARSLRKQGCNQPDMDHFFAGYGDALSGLAPDAFLYCHLSEVLRRWVTLLLLKHDGRPHGWKRKLELFRVARMARHMAAGLEKTL